MVLKTDYGQQESNEALAEYMPLTLVLILIVLLLLFRNYREPVVILLMMGTAMECIAVARRAKDVAGRIIAAGMGGLIAFQSFINIGVTTFLIPNTGLPLPFVSYGLTSLMSCFIGIGFVLNVRLQSGRGAAGQQT